VDGVGIADSAFGISVAGAGDVDGTATWR